MRDDLGPVMRVFVDGVPITPDEFQLEALVAVESRQSVVVTAPTGAGKTLIAQGAVYLALTRGERAFYTTPIKALSNQKFAEFRAVYGNDDVGLLTGDNVINGDAPVVVMTTEVLRNMIYADSDALRSLGVVVLDEVHYLQDRYRGPVWEEVIIHLPEEVSIVALSATIANAAEFTGWVRSRRGPTVLVVEAHRPVPLESLYLLKDRHHGTLISAPIFGSGGRANGELVRLLRRGRGRFRRRFATPRRLEVIERLAAESLLPAIYFIFSRAGCEQAASTVAEANLGLTTPDERAAIRRIVEERTAHIALGDLAVLGYDGWLEHLQRGVAAHHAGMIPAFKEAVEDVFAAGFVKIVFATETLSLGINMPARSVVLESLSRFSGEGHELLQPGDYTQLTGRAGRRGIDTRGSAVVLHSPYVPFDKVADIAGTGSHVLESAFQPTYNMAVNLVANYERETAFDLLRASFASYRREEHRRALEVRLSERQEELATFRANAECERGDIWEYITSPRAIDGSYELWKRVQPGDVIADDPRGRRFVVLARSWGGRSPQLMVLNDAGEVRTIRQRDAPPALAVIGTVELPEPFSPRDREYQHTVTRLLTEFEGDGTLQPVYGDHAADPVSMCADLETHLKWARRAARAASDVERLRRRLHRRGDDLAAQFTGVLRLLGDWGYVSDWDLTDRGSKLRWVYNEMDLLLTESVTRGIFDGLTPAQMAAAASLFTYEARRGDVSRGWPDGVVAARGDAIDALWTELAAAEDAAHVPVTRRPDAGFSSLVYSWAEGADLDDLFGEDDFAAGDFVRNCRQLLDLLRQLRDAFPELSGVTAAAVGAVDRGIVAAGGRL